MTVDLYVKKVSTVLVCLSWLGQYKDFQVSEIVITPCRIISKLWLLNGNFCCKPMHAFILHCMVCILLMLYFYFMLSTWAFVDKGCVMLADI
jgi:hypothetical protein